MNAIAKITTILQDQLAAEVVEIVDQTHKHAGHAGRREAPAGSGHYDAIVVSPQFANKTMMQQHRLVYAALSDLMQSEIHALSIKTYTPEQFQQLQAN
ncbi:transcriptional regulator, BolA protein family [Thalassoporum mexicanum PCC 7367]|uniref:BolA family protein n=1 Tax=Thalassoporum mexicanum TaxID=3457544 RepID=UPI00029FC868|nr:BolA family protein [Pseudanabaena sp. PCC 7367]AFY68758.1 transcriptional regulator, BolA protein family [Pseudanabaena sp. PCC 7367]